MAKKKIEDYLSLYLGCRVLTNQGPGTLVMVSKPEDPAGISPLVSIDDGDPDNIEYVKPVLIAIEDIPVKVLEDIVSVIYQGIFNEDVKLKHSEKVTGYSGQTGLKCVTSDNHKIGLSVEKDRGVEFSFNSARMMVDQFAITLILLKEGIDLFGLIESDLAIDVHYFLLAKDI